MKGSIGQIGPIGNIPKHEWEGSKLRFQNLDANGNLKWDNYVNLVGKTGNQGIQGQKGQKGIRVKKAND